MTTLRQHRGLIVAVLASLVVASALRYGAFLWIRPYFVLQVFTAFQNVVCLSLCASVAIVAALLPQRHFVGLVWATAYGIGVIVANWLADMVRLPVPAEPHISHVIDTLSVFVVAQGLRFALGWRLANELSASSHAGGQFRLLDVFEWTTSIAVLLAFAQLWGISLQDAAFVAPLFTETLLVCVPVALVAMTERGLTWWRVGLVLLWTLGIRIGEILAMHVVMPSQPL